MQINLAKSAVENLLDLLNAKNPQSTPFSSSNIAFGVPAAALADIVLPATATANNQIANQISISGADATWPAFDVTCYNSGTNDRFNMDFRGNTISGHVEAANAKISFEKLKSVTFTDSVGGTLIGTVTGTPVVSLTPNGGDDYTIGVFATVVWSGTATDFTTSFAHGTAATMSSVEVTYNTSVVVAATANAGFSGSKAIRYRRLAIGEATTLAANSIVDIPDEPSTQDIIDAVAEQAGLVAAELRLVGYQQAATPEEMGIATVTGILGGLIYLGGVGLQRSFATRLPQQDMEEAIPEIVMDGFDTPSE